MGAMEVMEWVISKEFIWPFSVKEGGVGGFGVNCTGGAFGLMG